MSGNKKAAADVSGLVDPVSMSMFPTKSDMLEHLLRQREEAASTLQTLAASNAALEAEIERLRKENEWQPIETAPFNVLVDLWCKYPEEPATWGNGIPAGEIIHNRHKNEKYGWFGNQSDEGVPRANGKDIIPVAWRSAISPVPMEIVEAFTARAALSVPKGGAHE